ncbi:TPA: hypothetical protein DEB29_03555 [Candidatus Wolfebacteria bacterium]|nr:hypothetical protein [Candidatus Wolfebacteria bacterium]
MIDAALVSAQRRKRLFWTNIPGVKLPEDRQIFLKDILEQEVDEKYYISDATLQTILEKMRQGKPIAQAFRIHEIDGKSVTLSSGGGGTGAKTGLYAINPDGSEKLKSNTIRTSGLGSKFGDKHNWDQIAIVGKSRGKNAGYQSSEKAPTLTGSSWQYNNFIKLYNDGNLIVRRLTPLECCRLQSVPDHYTEVISNNQQYRCLGNAFNADVISHILGHIPNE